MYVIPLYQSKYSNQLVYVVLNSLRLNHGQQHHLRIGLRKHHIHLLGNHLYPGLHGNLIMEFFYALGSLIVIGTITFSILVFPLIFKD